MYMVSRKKKNEKEKCEGVYKEKHETKRKIELKICFLCKRKKKKKREKRVVAQA